MTEVIRESPGCLDKSADRPAKMLNASGIIIVGALFLSLALILAIVFLSTMVADDFTRAARVETKGVLASILFEYATWDGRFTSFSIEYAVAQLLKGPQSYRVVLAIFNVASFITLSLAAYAWLRRTAAESLIAGAALYVILWNVSSDTADSFYWLTGHVENIFSVSVCLLVLGMFVHGAYSESKPRSAHQAALCCGVFVACGFHELYAVGLVAMIGCVIAAVAWQRRGVEPWIIIFLLFAIAALVIVLAAPGNAIRTSHFTGSRPTIAWLLTTGMFKSLKSISSLLTAPSTIVGVTLLFLYRISGCSTPSTGLPVDRGRTWVLWLAIIVGLFIVPLALTGDIASRTHDGVALLFLMLLMYVVSQYAERTRPRISLPPAVARQMLLYVSSLWLLVVVGGDRAKAGVYDLMHSGPYRAAVEERHKFLSSHTGTDARVLVAPIANRPRLTFRDDVTPDAKHWLNQGIAKYYQIAEIALGSENSISAGPIIPSR
jgi:hypothetical protein